MTEHGLAGLMLTTEPGRPIVVCLCGCIASGVKGVTWTVNAVDGEGKKFSCSPSFDWPGHFHVTATQAPVIEFPENYRGEPC